MSEPFIRDPRFASVMRKLVEALRGWSWCLIGGRATEVWENPPQTPDVDVLVDLSTSGNEMKAAITLIRQLQHYGFRFGEKAEVGDAGDAIFYLVEEETGVEVDLLTALDEFHVEAISEAPLVTVQRVSFPVADAEHVLVLKAQAAVSSGRPIEKRSRDRKAILALGPRVVKSRLRDVLRRHQTLLAEEAALLKFLRVL